MGRTSTNKMSHVVSCRVNEREMAALRRQAQKSGVSMTTLLRQSLNLTLLDNLSSRQHS